FSAHPAPAEQAQAALDSVKEVAIAKSVSEMDSQGSVVNGLLQLKQNPSGPTTPTVDTVQSSRSLADVRLQRAPAAVEALADQYPKPSAPAGAPRSQAGQAAPPAQQTNAGQLSSQEAEQIAATPAGQPVEVVIPHDLDGKDVLVAAICRGVTVATTA